MRDVIAAHGLSAKKSLGQNFLLDLNLTRRIARAAGDRGSGLGAGTTFEVGPGPGGLTRALLLEGAGSIVAVEKDPRAIEALRDLITASDGRLTVINGDALETDFLELGQPPRRIAANVPYNISTPLLIRWISEAEAYESITLMLQAEVVDRLAAKPGTKTYGRLSVLSQWRCEVEPLFSVPASAFTPPPKVDSTVVRLVPRAEPLARCRQAMLEKVTAAAFGQRRKMLRASLKSLKVPDTLALCREAGLDPTTRAEQLSVEDFCRLAEAVDHFDA